MPSKKNINRRKFMGSVATVSGAAAFTIVPRHVLGKGYVPPSDKINVANIGCGSQGLWEMVNMLENDEIRVAAVCDVNEYTTDYLDWSTTRLLGSIRKTLGDPSWGNLIKGIPGGRVIGQRYVDDFYKKKNSRESYKACKSYEDYRELLEKENDIDAVKIMTPDHHHAAIAIAAMKKGKHVITHKPIANRLAEGRMAIEGAKKYDVRTHLLAWEDKSSYALIKSWIDDGVIGSLKEIHNWSYRPVWPQYMEVSKDRPEIPNGFNWDLWLGPEKDRPYSPEYTHMVFRGWFDFGGGSIADMGHYSLFPLFRTLGIESSPISAKAYGSSYRTTINQVSRALSNKDAYPYSSICKFQFPVQKELGAFDLYWYDGGMKPFAPEELEEDGRDIPLEGLMLVGDKGTILAGFDGDNPEILPKREMEAYAGGKTWNKTDPERRSDTWVQSIKSGKESAGSFLHAGPITDMVNLGAVALRTRKKLEFDSENMKITNDEDANKYLHRDYRKGWNVSLD